MHYSKHEQECQSAAERFTSDITRSVSVVNGLNIRIYLSYKIFAKKFSNSMFLHLFNTIF